MAELVVRHGDRLISIGIEGAVQSRGPSGFPVETFTALPPTVWGARLAAPSTERQDAGQLVGQVATEYVIPYRPDMDPDVLDVKRLRRLRVAGAVLDILDARNVGRRVQIRLLTREKVTGA